MPAIGRIDITSAFLMYDITGHKESTSTIEGQQTREKKRQRAHHTVRPFSGQRPFTKTVRKTRVRTDILRQSFTAVETGSRQEVRLQEGQTAHSQASASPQEGYSEERVTEEGQREPEKEWLTNDDLCKYIHEFESAKPADPLQFLFIKSEWLDVEKIIQTDHQYSSKKSFYES